MNFSGVFNYKTFSWYSFRAEGEAGEQKFVFKDWPLLKGQWRKNERGRLKANHFSSWSRPMKVLYDVPDSRNWYKTVKFIRKFIYIQFRIEIVGLNRS